MKLILLNNPEKIVKMITLLIIILCNPVYAETFFPKDYEESRERFLNKSHEISSVYKDVIQGAIPVGSEKLT